MPVKLSSCSSSTACCRRGRPDAAELLIAAQQLVDLFLERVELRRALGAAKPGRRIGPQGGPHRIARETRAPGELLDRHAAHEVLSPQLGPAFHVQHSLSPGLGDTTEPGSSDPRTPSPPPRRVNSPPSKGGQFSTGADTRWMHSWTLRTSRLSLRDLMRLRPREAEWRLSVGEAEWRTQRAGSETVACAPSTRRWLLPTKRPNMRIRTRRSKSDRKAAHALRD